MKIQSFTLAVILIATALAGRAQDTIRFGSGEIKVVKVAEIGIQDVRYKRFDNPDGPTYVAAKSEITYIRFGNGTLENFKETAASTSTTTTTQATPSFTPMPQTTVASSPQLIVIKGRRLYYNSYGLGETRLKKVIENTTNPAKLDMLRKEYATMKSYKRAQYITGFGGLGLALVCVYAGTITYVLTDNVGPMMVGLGAGTMVGLSGGITSIVFKSKREKQKIKVAELYNQQN